MNSFKPTTLTLLPLNILSVRSYPFFVVPVLEVSWFRLGAVSIVVPNLTARGAPSVELTAPIFLVPVVLTRLITTFLFTFMSHKILGGFTYFFFFLIGTVSLHHNLYSLNVLIYATHSNSLSLNTCFQSN